MHVLEITTRKQLQQFIRLPLDIYREDKNWVPPLWSGEHKEYKPGTNVMLNGNEHVLLLLYDNDIPCGRMIVHIDRAYNAHWHTTTGMFGAFECINSDEAALLLIEHASTWLAKRGMQNMLGPVNPVAESWGFLVSGHESLPVFMASYNPPYYNRLMEFVGMQKAKDLLAYEVDVDATYSLPERIKRFVALLQKRRPQFTVRQINTGRLKVEASHIWNISNISLASNWGYVPVGIEVMQDMVRRLKLLLDPQAIWFVEDNGKPVGYALGFPDPNPVIQSIRGHLFPFGFLKLLPVHTSSNRYRLFALAVLPEYHGIGLDALLYHALHTGLQGRGIRLEANYILEDNPNIRNAIEKLGMRLCKTYRMYSKPLDTYQAIPKISKQSE